MVGSSSSSWGNPQRASTLGSGLIVVDAFVAKLDNTGQLVWNTFLGGGDMSSSGAGGSAIAVDGSGNVYVTGYSSATWGNPLRAFSGSFDAFVAKLDNTGQLVWNTFLGGGMNDYGNAILDQQKYSIY